jgi:hypothetical protein
VDIKEQESSESDIKEQKEVSTLEMVGIISTVGAAVVIAAIIGQLALNTLMRLDLGITELVAFTIADILVGIIVLYWIFNR